MCSLKRFGFFLVSVSGDESVNIKFHTVPPCGSITMYGRRNVFLAGRLNSCNTCCSCSIHVVILSQGEPCHQRRSIGKQSQKPKNKQMIKNHKYNNLVYLFVSNESVTHLSPLCGWARFRVVSSLDSDTFSPRMRILSRRKLRKLLQ